MKKMVKNKPIKIMRVIARMNVGGPAIQITNMLNGLPEKEFNQQLYFGSCENGEAENISGIKNASVLHRIPGFKRSIGILDEFRVLFHLIGEIKLFNPHVIHTHTAKAGILGRAAAILARSSAKRVHTFHGHLLYGYFNPVITYLYASLERVLAHHTDVIISVGPEVREDLLRNRIGKPSQHQVIFPGITVGARVPRSQALGDLHLSNHNLTIAFIGRFTSIKRINRIIELARRCRQEKLDVQFLLAGEGPELASIQKCAEVENLPMVFLGWRSDIERILSAADVLLLTSDNEGTPIASIQASLLAVPTLATNVGSLHDIVVDGETGILVSKDINELFSAIMKLYGDSSLSKRLGERAKRFAEKEFSLTRFLEDYENLYRLLTD
jgi:glycosyltransferase involved in cell wall biosynthesis